jgi:hypothetical protein
MKPHIGGGTMSINPDPKKYAIRFRKGHPVLFERENLDAIKRWREKKAKAALGTPRIMPVDALYADSSPSKAEVKGVGARMPNLFSDDDI